jgi:hypothetical protein
VSGPTSRRPTRRQFIAVGAVTVTAASLDRFSLPAYAAGDALGSCPKTTVWMLDPDWGYLRGPHGKTRLVSRASRLAAENRVARTEQEALDMNLHKCSFAPAIPIEVCADRAVTAFASGATDWNNPWNGSTVSVLDLRRLPANEGLFAASASSSPGGAGPLAFTGSGDRRLLFMGAGAAALGTALRMLSRNPRPL